jgi:hypothetical protein
MQFPTCKAPVRRDGIRISTLFDEFAASKFTGYCKILMGREEHILALKEGAYILAESGAAMGAEAFKAIVDLSSSMGGAILCPLTVKQFQVTLLFNAPFRIIFTAEPDTAAGNSSIPAEITPGAESPPIPGRGTAPVTRIQPVSLPSTGGKMKQVRSIKITAELEEESEQKKPVHVRRAGEGGRATKKIDQLTLESIKELKETFQADAADLLRELHMEHLIHPEEKNSKKSHSENR